MSKTVSFITRNFGSDNPPAWRPMSSSAALPPCAKALDMDGDAIAQLLADNGVQGRGGAAYDMGRKWSQARRCRPHKCVVCNADEG